MILILIDKMIKSYNHIKYLNFIIMKIIILKYLFFSKDDENSKIFDINKRKNKIIIGSKDEDDKISLVDIIIGNFKVNTGEMKD
jgi:hypothetical protein